MYLNHLHSSTKKGRRDLHEKILSLSVYVPFSAAFIQFLNINLTQELCFSPSSAKENIFDSLRRQGNFSDRDRS